MDKNKLEESLKFETRDLAIMALLIAMEVVISRFLSISLWNMKIGFAFVPLAYAAMRLGPLKAGIVGGLADFIGAILFPIGTYFPGFSFTAFLRGATLGLFLYNKQTTKGIIIAVLINQLIISLGINTLWISILYGSPYWGIFVSRIPQTILLITVQIIVIKTLSKGQERLLSIQ